jgi:alpha-tubulin suppressor-like RCC1 family protein
MRNHRFGRLLLPLVVVVTVVAAACVPTPPSGGDTTAPVLTITNRQDGDTVDGSLGQLQLLEGTVSDVGSGVASVEMTAPDGSSVVAALDPTGTWVAPIGAPVSGDATFTVKAVDKAGNSSERSLVLSMIALPTTAGTVVRPSTLQLTAEVQAELTSLTATTLVFNGNLEGIFQGFTTVLSGPVGALAPDGFIRSLESVSFSAAENKTTVVTSDAGLLDAFAQFDYVTPPIDVTDPPAAQGRPGIAQAVAPSECDKFIEDSTVRVKATASFSLGLGGQLVDSSIGASMTASATVAFKAKVDVKVKVGWTGAKVSGSISSGMMVCGSTQILGKINFKKDFPVFGVPIPAGTIFGVGISLEPEAGIRFQVDTQGSLPTTEYYAGIDVAYKIGTSPKVTYPHGASAIGGVGDIGFVSFGGYASMDLGLGIAGQNGAEIGLIDSDFALKATYDTNTIDLCPVYSGAFAPFLKLQIPRTPLKVIVFELDYRLEFTAACIELWNKDDTPVPTTTTTTTTPTTTTTTTTTTTVPPVLSLTGATKVSGGGFHSCAIGTGGAVKCWGDRRSGQLGDGTGGVYSGSSSVPVPVSGITGATQVAAGRYHSCAIVTGGAVKCWGGNSYGQLGAGSNADSKVPVDVSGITGATQISTGDSHSCLLGAGGAVKCWGNNSFGQLGDGSSSNSNVPVPVSGITGATQVAAGSSHSCALVAGGAVKCWGNNSQGKLGDGSTSNSSVPVPVSGITGATQISTGQNHSCAVVAGGAVKCWGNNFNGQLGDGSTSNSSVPVPVSGITGATQISTGDNHSCALGAGGAVKCWGNNFNGQLGDGSTSNSNVPVPVSGMTGATEIEAGENHSCALGEAEVLKCWGYNSNGQLGDGSTSNSNVPVGVLAGV